MIEQINHVLFLCILIYDKYNWNYHINYIRAKLSRLIAIINKIKDKLPLQNGIGNRTNIGIGISYRYII